MEMTKIVHARSIRQNVSCEASGDQRILETGHALVAAQRLPVVLHLNHLRLLEFAAGHHKVKEGSAHDVENSVAPSSAR